MCYNILMMKKYILSVLIVLVIPVVLVQAVHAEVKVGSSRQEVVSAFGEPSGVMTSGKEEVLSYPGGMIVIVDGKVSSMDKDFSQRLESRKEQQKFAAQQEKKGLVEDQGKWVTPQEKQNIAQQKKLNQSVMIFNNNGAEITVEQIVVPGKITLALGFYALSFTL